MLKTEIEFWERMAEIEVLTVKELDARVSIPYLLFCINGLRKIISDENPYSIAASDMRYRAFVLKVLSEYRKQELPDFDVFFIRVLTGRVIRSNEMK